MTVTVKKAVLWRREVANRPGTLAETLKPLAEAGVNLEVVLGYTCAGDLERSAVEVYPIAGDEAQDAARLAGLAPAERVTCLVVQGNDRIGLGRKVAEALAAAGINIHFVMVQTSGKKYTALFGFKNDIDAEKAILVVKRASREDDKSGKSKQKPLKKSAAKFAKPKKKGAEKKAGVAKKVSSKKKSVPKKKPVAKKVAPKKPVTKKPAGKKKATSKKNLVAKQVAVRKDNRLRSKRK